MKNKRKWLLFLAIAVGAIFAGYKYFFSAYARDIVAERPGEPLLAYYDRNDQASPVAPGQCRHITVRWNNKGTGFGDELDKLMTGSQPVLITVEVWPSMGGRFSKENILSMITSGVYDEKIKVLGGVLSTKNQTVMLRLNPDMEVYVNRYPWQMQGADMYSGAFRHFSEILKKAAPAVKMVWAPAGYPGTEEYWPGNQWVDMVSVTLKGNSERMTNNYPEESSLSQLIFRKLHRLRFFDKPALVIGSDIMTREKFRQASFDSAVNYIRLNKATEYLDVNAADKKMDSANLRKKGALELGIFDPFGKIIGKEPVSTEHIFVNLRMLRSGEFKTRFDSAVSRNHHLIVTMEPWRDKDVEKDPLLADNILNGKYDTVFNLLYAVISGSRTITYLRWLHEMEIPIKRYPWQSMDPVQYIKAYRYFVNFIRDKKPTNLFFVWGPAGDRGSMEFWPGSDVVDYTSIAIYGLPDKNITDHNKQESFNTIFKRKYRRIGFAHKPLFITEFGVKGPPSYKQQWLAGAAATIESNPEITGVSYFNDADNPKAWGDIEAPDWGITPAVFAAFRSQLKTAVKQ